MKKKRIISGMICLVLVLAMIIPMFMNIIPVSATPNDDNGVMPISNTETISTTKIDEIEFVPCKQLMEKYKYVVTTSQDEVKGFGLSILINNDLINIYQNSGQLLLNGTMLPLETIEMTDEITNEKYQFPVNKQPMKTDDDTDFYISCNTLNKFLNIPLPQDGTYIFETETSVNQDNSTTFQEPETTNNTVTIQSGEILETTKEKTIRFD